MTWNLNLILWYVHFSIYNHICFKFLKSLKETFPEWKTFRLGITYTTIAIWKNPESRGVVFFFIKISSIFSRQEWKSFDLGMQCTIHYFYLKTPSILWCSIFQCNCIILLYRHERLSTWVYNALFQLFENNLDSVA